MLRLPIDHEVLTGAISFLGALNWGTPALFLYFTLRRYLQAFNHVRPIAWALVTANLINVVGNWLLIFGHSWGPIHIPALGVTGAGLATSISRCYLALFLVISLWRIERRHHYGLASMVRHFEPTRLRRLALLGAPAGGQIFVEIAIFGTVTFLIGTMGRLPLAGHEIALNCASFTFMVPFAISAAAAVRVGQAIGRNAPHEAASAGWAAIALGAGAMACFSAILLLFPHAIARSFTADPAVIAATVPLLFVAAIFQFFDGLQITATGALRGAGNTHAGLIVQIIGYWIIGLPIGYLLGFRLHQRSRRPMAGSLRRPHRRRHRPHHHLAPHHKKTENQPSARTDSRFLVNQQPTTKTNNPHCPSRYINNAIRLACLGIESRYTVSPSACAPSPIAPVPTSPGT